MFGVVDFRTIDEDLEGTVPGLEGSPVDERDEAFGATPVGDEIGDGNDGQPVLPGKGQAGPAGA